MALRSAIGVLATYASGALASCAHGTSLFPRAEGGAIEVNTFGYTGEIGPNSWSLLEAGNAACSTGSRQTPIDLVTGAFTVIPAADIALNIPDFPQGATFENLGTTVEVVAQGGNMTFDGTPFALQQFHFHLPSEHLNEGMSMAMEMHMVWEGEQGQIAVVSTFIDIADSAAAAAPAAAPVAQPASPIPVIAAGNEARSSKFARRQLAKEQSNERREFFTPGATVPVATAPAAAPSAVAPPATAQAATNILETVFASVNGIATPGTATQTGPLVMSEIVNQLNAGNFKTYAGSLTTPPCSEGVRWLVSDQTLAVNLNTFKAARSVIGFNSRPPQNFVGGGQPTRAAALAAVQEKIAKEKAAGQAPAA